MLAQRAPWNQTGRDLQIRLANTFMDHGFAAGVKDGLGYTALHWCAVSGSTALASEFISRGADVDAQEVRTKITPLHFASGYGKIEMVKLLLEDGADPNAKCGVSRTTPIEEARARGHIAVANYLKEWSREHSKK